ncbi:MAG TPA: hypothetical protein VJL90_03660, partial [Pseudorhodoplanes sp.]|nr:hypothetical protein [Pseudorhodoplanes sp.]
MGFVHGILEMLIKIPFEQILICFDDGIAFKGRIFRKGRRVALTHEHEDQAKIFPRRIAWNLDSAREAFRFCGLFHALPARIVFPAMIGTANVVSLHITGGQLQPTVRATIADGVR